MMAMHYSDQMTGASANVMNLQCFVGHHLKEVRVVEPFLHRTGSTLGVSLSPSHDKLDPQDVNTVKLSDVYNINEWTEYSRSQQYAPLISWNDFLDSRSKRLILVHHTWKINDCGVRMIEATKEFATENEFDIVRKVCINFRNTGVLSPQKFQDTIYGEFKPSEVVVVFNHWGGISRRVEDDRLSVSDTSCYRNSEIRLNHHSKLISSDCKNYSTKYLNNTDKYIAVMIRVEHFALNRMHKLSTESQQNKLMECFRSINAKVESIKQERNINSTLLTMDIGRYGSIALRRKKVSLLDINVLNQAAHDLFEMMFGKSLTQDKWEQTFEEVAQFKVPGYIAIMQQALAANSVCLLLVGGGGYQGSTNTLYSELHPSSKCVLHAC